MIWPWVKRERWQAAENLRLDATMRLGASEALRQQLTTELAAARQELREHRKAADEERERLLNRIAQLTGQAPIYGEVQRAAAPAASVSSEKPGPQLMARARLTQDEIHAKFREAAASGRVKAADVRAF